MNLQKIIAFCFFSFSFILSDGQAVSEKNYPQGYFQWPVIAKHALAANFGELRPNHYHMGLDCKTDQHENVRVVAAAEGYIAKVKIEPFGFGRCIYINHPNGFTTLYAHLNTFYPALEKYISAQQYQLESWKIFIDIPVDLFPVTKGQFIANSGNTGGSQGPHTHFEIRDTKTDKCLNPLQFGFDLNDNTPPDILRLAVYDRNKSTYEQNPVFYPIKKVNSIYITTPGILNCTTDKVSFAITAYDRYTGSTSHNGIYGANLYEDEKQVVGFEMDSIGYDETRYVNAHIDYKLRAGGGSWMQHLSRLPGYLNGIYKEISGDGVINIAHDTVHQIKIAVKDAAGNTTYLKFGIRQAEVSLPTTTAVATSTNRSLLFYPETVNIFENENISFYMPENCLYDSFAFKYAEIAPNVGFTIFQLQNASIPVQALFPVKIKNNNAAYPEKMVMHRFTNDKNDFEKAVKEGDWYKANFKAFGNFQLLEDLVPPNIRPIGFREGMLVSAASRLIFVVTDNTEAVAFRATLDGKWLRFSNDKGKTFIYKLDEHCGVGAHELIITATDRVGNKTEKRYHFRR